MMPAIDRKPTNRYAEKQEAILREAIALINERGIKGFSLGDVALRCGFTSNGVAYYFRRKDDLAAECFARALDLADAIIDRAERESTPLERVRSVVASNFELIARVRRGEAQKHVRLDDLRAMPDPWRGMLMARGDAAFRRTRQLFGPFADDARSLQATASAHILWETMFHLNDWLVAYDVDDLPRVERHLTALLEGGIFGTGAPWRACPLPDRDDGESPERRRFILAATRLIGHLGYNGASVDRISAELQVTKGSFYHHLPGKDELVLTCFHRSLATVLAAQRSAIALDADWGARVASFVVALLDVQFSGSGPLLRSTAFALLPPELRDAVSKEQSVATLRLTGMLVDAQNERATGALDPLIAANYLMGAINAASEFNTSVARRTPQAAVEIYATALFNGIFTGS